MTLALVAPVAAGAAWLSWYSGQWVANRAMRHLRTRLLGHLVRLDLAFHQTLARGDLLTRLTTDLTSTLRVQQYLYGKILQRPLESLGVIAGLWWFCGPGIALAVAAIIAPVAAVLIPLVRRTRRHSHRARETLAANVGVMEQITAGIKVIKAYGSAEREQLRYDAHNASLERDNLRLARTRALNDAVSAGAVFLIAGGALAACGWLFAHTPLEPLHLFVAIAALARLITSVREAIRTWGDLQENLPSVERVYALLDRVSAIADRPDARDCAPPQVAITIEQVRFHHGNGDEVLRGVDLALPVGSTTAIVGESGCGKSTLLSLLLRLHDVTGGRIALDGTDLRDFKQESLARQFALVQQDDFLFHDTVAANIRYGRPGASDADIEQAARRAHVHEAILALEGGRGYATVVGDRGGRLSGGQRQRIAIARAFLRDAPVLLLDEPTSALDADSERHVQEALAELMQGRTVVIVAHRLATIQHADRIVVLAGKDDPRRGTVLESGSHDQLLAKGGEYARLVGLQQLRH